MFPDSFYHLLVIKFEPLSKLIHKKINVDEIAAETGKISYEAAKGCGRRKYAVI
jgi:alanine racemase